MGVGKEDNNERWFCRPTHSHYLLTRPSIHLFRGRLRNPPNSTRHRHRGAGLGGGGAARGGKFEREGDPGSLGHGASFFFVLCGFVCFCEGLPWGLGAVAVAVRRPCMHAARRNPDSPPKNTHIPPSAPTPPLKKKQQCSPITHNKTIDDNNKQQVEQCVDPGETKTIKIRGVPFAATPEDLSQYFGGLFGEGESAV